MFINSKYHERYNTKDFQEKIAVAVLFRDRPRLRRSKASNVLKRYIGSALKNA